MDFGSLIPSCAELLLLVSSIALTMVITAVARIAFVAVRIFFTPIRGYPEIEILLPGVGGNLW
jgi:hypothetical protein